MQATAQRLTRAGLRIEEFPQSPANLTAASQNLFELIQGQNLILYPDAGMRLAISRTVAIETARGWRIAKEKQSHKIDVVVALAMAALAAVQLHNEHDFNTNYSCMAVMLTITGVNLAVPAGIVAAIGDIGRFKSPQKLTRAPCWSPGPRTNARSAARFSSCASAPGAAIRSPRCLARKLTVLCWHLLTKGEDYQWARPTLVANKTRAMQLQAGHPQQKGSRRGPAYAYNIKALRGPRDADCRPGGAKLRTLRNAMEAAAAKKSARGRLSSAGQNKQSGDACSRCTTLRHEVARALQP